MKDELLNLYLDGRLSPDEAQRVDRALEADPAIRRRFESLLEAHESVQAAFAMPDDLPAFDEVWSGVEARLDEEASAASVPGVVERWWSWLFRPGFALAAGAALVAAIVAGAWLTGRPGDGGAGAGVELAATAPTAPIGVAPGARRELPVENGRRGMVGEEKSPRSLAVVESFDVEKGVVVVSGPTGSAKNPLVIWHLVPGEEFDEERGQMP